MKNIENNLKILRQEIKGDLFDDLSSRIIYATDASAYREIPFAIARPKNNDDIKKLILFAKENNVSLIPRTAGTSLAGQVVGGGIVVDVSKYLTKIVELNEKEKWVKLQPGVILDELNRYLSKLNLFFAPETSTSNRCMIGGMVGNNSCGSHSLIYGSTRDHVISIKAILSDCSEIEFTDLSIEEFKNKCELNTLEGNIYRNIRNTLSLQSNQEEIRSQYPDKSLKRRNTGYAIDILLESEPFTPKTLPFNFSKLICGSEGTLAFITEIKLNLIPLPPKEKAVICIHFNSIKEALQANLIALEYQPGAIELMDNIIIECTKDNIEQQKNRFFLEGSPAALLIVEFARETKEEINNITDKMEKEMRSASLGYHFPVIFGSEIIKVWNLRKAGLGLLSNYPGDKRPVTVIEDTAVNVNVLSDYIDEFQHILDKFNLKCVYYAHIGTGEIHLRPVLNLKDKKEVELFHTIAFEVALLVKKYKGSLSGEHGDGRLRGEFIPLMIGSHNYNLLKEIKSVWDPSNIFNPGKIVDTPPMNTSLRYRQETITPMIETIFDFSQTKGILRAAEKCNGSGDCRKTEVIGGMMCPSYMATKDENTTTRARANILREFLTNSTKQNPFNHKEIYNILDLCLSCKGCKSECPSNVDMAKLKAEFLYQYYKTNSIPLRTILIANIAKINKIGAYVPTMFNFFIANKFLSKIIKKTLGFAEKRSIPLLYKFTLKKWALKNLNTLNENSLKTKKVYLFCDEFTNYNDVEIGIKAIKLLIRLNYYVVIADNKESGRAYLSKGILKKAKTLANFNINLYKDKINEAVPLIGIEPSAILSFRDEYPLLVDANLKDAANRLAKNVFLIDEFLANEFENGSINSNLFTVEFANIKLHGHCHQKVLASIEPTKKILQIPINYRVDAIASGCCGMAGSFGYEKEHYELSQKVGELILFPAVRNSKKSDIIAAPGTSCRHQIKDGTGRDIFHPIELLFDALKK
ncbi:MAG: FAD-binding oxidoreductase [Bacteroidetes bacterium CG2_30_32_10]|nr:MAG: FAD-binding oxidoreductase [Bacteroidetes bacterium CG2_30_32_10]